MKRLWRWFWTTDEAGYWCSGAMAMAGLDCAIDGNWGRAAFSYLAAVMAFPVKK